MASAAPHEVLELTLIGKPDCPLCDEMRRVIDEVLPHQGAALLERDVRNDPALMERYGSVIPVLMAGEREVVRTRTSPEDLRRRLALLGYGSPT